MDLRTVIAIVLVGLCCIAFDKAEAKSRRQVTCPYFNPASSQCLAATYKVINCDPKQRNACPRGQTCCNGCYGYECFPKPRPKKVICPYVEQNWCLLADPSYCYSDVDCPYNSKCCVTTSCGGTNCVPTPVTEKPGYCPATPRYCPAVIQEDDCKTDSECFGQSKCCQLCKKECTVPAKRGTCPPNPPDVITICEVGCTSDQVCDGDAKCCPYGCTHTCQKPV